MTPELRQLFNRVRRRNEVTEQGFLDLLDEVGGDATTLESIFNT
jgi:hypothetical protein